MDVRLNVLLSVAIRRVTPTGCLVTLRGETPISIANEGGALLAVGALYVRVGGGGEGEGRARGIARGERGHGAGHVAGVAADDRGHTGGR